MVDQPGFTSRSRTRLLPRPAWAVRATVGGQVSLRGSIIVDLFIIIDLFRDEHGRSGGEAVEPEDIHAD